jgi:threonylcarbamoyladenosine tRNA methylthiotransferase MtaB
MKVYLRTFGCRANHYDSELARALIEAAGSTIVTSPEEADVALFNSCAVTADAEADLRQQVRRAARVQPRIRSIVMGCAPALDARGMAAEPLRALPTIDQVIAGADLHALADALGVPAPAPFLWRMQSTARAVLRVQDGCDEHCTFCATRLARGASRSRPAGELVVEARALARFHREIVVTGINIASYGADIGSSLGVLVATLVDAVPEVRLRLSSLEPTLIDDGLAALLGGDPRRVVPFLHAPLQSGSARLLRRMGRSWYTPESYAEAVLRVIDGRAVFGLSADIIVGFPGETDADHRATVRLVERLPYTALHIFPYSARPGTAAQRLVDPVPSPVRRERVDELRELAKRKATAYRRARVGTMADVIVIDEDGERRGVTEDLLTVAVTDRSIPRGSRVDARLAERSGGLLALVAEAIVQ